ncbi:MAG: hypothetical protein IT488_02885 [Gammaproteobacteria bacterium]|nr:hypothetical protein [Gammaproteobacteria bacterium]
MTMRGTCNALFRMLYNCHNKNRSGRLMAALKTTSCGGGKMTTGDILILYAVWFVLTLGLAVFLFKKNA